MDLFFCRPLTVKITRYACARRSEMAGKTGKGQMGETGIRQSPCRECPIGKAHLAGLTPTAWPDGNSLELVEQRDLGTARTGLVQLRTPTTVKRAASAQKPAVRAPAPEAPRKEIPVATKKKRRNGAELMITHGGETLNHTQWGQRLGMTGAAIASRLRRGWAEGDAVSTPKGELPNGEPKAESADERLRTMRVVSPPPASSRPAPGDIVAALGYEVQQHPAVVAGGWHLIMWRLPA